MASRGGKAGDKIKTRPARQRRHARARRTHWKALRTATVNCLTKRPRLQRSSFSRQSTKLAKTEKAGRAKAAKAKTLWKHTTWSPNPQSLFVKKSDMTQTISNERPIVSSARISSMMSASPSKKVPCNARLHIERPSVLNFASMFLTQQSSGKTKNFGIVEVH